MIQRCLLVPGIVGLLLGGWLPDAWACAYDRKFGEDESYDLRLDTVSGEKHAPPLRFEATSTRGTLEGAVAYLDGGLQVLYSLKEEAAALTFSPHPILPEEQRIALVFEEVGSLEFETSGGELLPTAVRVPDCTGLGESDLYRAMVEVSEALQAQVADLDPEDASSTDLAVSTIFLLIRFAALAPDLAEVCRELTAQPLYGVCVTHPEYEDCERCCETSRDLGALLRRGCGILAFGMAYFNPAHARMLGGACLVMVTAGNCTRDWCEGKPGDPSPVRCCDASGNQGTCKAACNQPAHTAVDACDVCLRDHVCCIGE